MSATGRIVSLKRESFECSGLTSAIGDLVQIQGRRNRVKGIVTGFRDGRVVGELFENPIGIEVEALVVSNQEPPSIPIGNGILGRALNSVGEPIDGKGPLEVGELHPLFGAASQMAPEPIEQLETGLRVLDALVPVDKGQQLMLWAPYGSGLGSRTVLEIIGRNCKADVVIYAQIGVSSEEYKYFYKEVSKISEKATLFATLQHATPVAHRICLESAVTAATAFAGQGKNVVLMVDSFSAWRNAGEFFGNGISEKLERLRSCSSGSVTSFFLVEHLLEEEIRKEEQNCGFDGRLVLSKEFARANIYPTVDPTKSAASRRFRLDYKSDHFNALEILREYQNNKDLIKMEALPVGVSPELDRVLGKGKELLKFIRQGVFEEAPLEKTRLRLKRLLSEES